MWFVQCCILYCPLYCTHYQKQQKQMVDLAYSQRNRHTWLFFEEHSLPAIKYSLQNCTPNCTLYSKLLCTLYSVPTAVNWIFSWTPEMFYCSKVPWHKIFFFQTMLPVKIFVRVAFLLFSSFYVHSTQYPL